MIASPSGYLDATHLSPWPSASILARTTESGSGSGSEVPWHAGSRRPYTQSHHLRYSARLRPYTVRVELESSNPNDHSPCSKRVAVTGHDILVPGAVAPTRTVDRATIDAPAANTPFFTLFVEWDAFPRCFEFRELKGRLFMTDSIDPAGC